MPQDKLGLLHPNLLTHLEKWAAQAFHRAPTVNSLLQELLRTH
jgi:hypothetical protein